MTTFPMSGMRVTLEHQGGTKFYVLTLIETNDGKGLFIRRWGPKGKFGSVMVEMHETIEAASRSYTKIFNDKTSGRKGYSQLVGTNESMVDIGDLTRFVGRPTWAQLSPDHLKFLDPSMDTTGVREPDPPRFDDNGNFIGNPEPRKVTYSPEELEAARQAEVAERQAKNPLFGRF